VAAITIFNEEPNMHDEPNKHDAAPSKEVLKSMESFDLPQQPASTEKGSSEKPSAPVEKVTAIAIDSDKHDMAPSKGVRKKSMDRSRSFDLPRPVSTDKGPVAIVRQSSMHAIAQVIETRQSGIAKVPEKKKPITLYSLAMSAQSACGPKREAPTKSSDPDEEWHMFDKASLMTKLKTNETTGLSTADAKVCLRS
jgi:hypothetical protein